nr:hypothetical protein [Paucilactobacillus kaifaensis]
MNSKLTDKRILVIGGTSGFGKQVSLQALQAGANVTIVGRQ